MAKSDFSARMWRRVVWVQALFVSSIMGAQAGTWVNVAPGGDWIVGEKGAASAPRVTVLGYDQTGVDLSVEIQGLELVPTSTIGGDFVRVECPSVAWVGEWGKPALPAVRRLIVVPEGATVDLQVSVGKPAFIELPELGIADAVMPNQPPIPQVPGELKRTPFRHDALVYELDRALPDERVTITPLGRVRGRQLSLLEVRPVAYNPAQAALQVWPRIEVAVRFAGGAAGPDRGALPALAGVLLNPPPTASVHRGQGNYLIVAGETYATSVPLSQFVAAKSAQGFTVSVHSVAPGTTKEAIKAHIESLWGTADAPDYLLLVGDVDVIPHWIGGGDRAATTDLPYACMDGAGDWYADMALGRISVNSISQLQDVVDKTLVIEDGAYNDLNYTRHAVFMSGMDVNSADEETHNWVIDTHMTPNGIVSDKLYVRSHGATTQDVHNAMSAGCVFASWYGHAGPGPDGNRIWQNGPQFWFPDVYGLEDGGLCVLLLNMTCNVGKYYLWDECFTEAWLRQPNKGAVVNIGASEFIYSVGHGGTPGWPETSDTQKFVFDSIYEDGIREVGLAWQAAMLKLIAKYGPSHPPCRDSCEMYNLLGDPSVRVPEPQKRLLIVAPQDFASCVPLRQYVAAKEALGFHVRVYTAAPGATNAAIKSYITGLWGTIDAPDYVLIVGDTSGTSATASTIPHWVGQASKQATTDWPYVCMDSGDDWYPEIPIGRFSVATEAQLQDVVDKTLFVESGSFPDADYVTRGAFLANPSTYGTAEPTHDWVIDNYFSPNNYQATKIYSAQGGDTQDVADAVNAGSLFTVYYGHSSSTGWWDPSFDQNDVNALHNAGLYGLVFGWSCNTAHYDNAECFGETWLRAPNKGAAAYISASNYIFWGSEAAWAPSAIHEKAFFAAFFEDGIWEVGPAWMAGLYRFLTEYGQWDGNHHSPPQVHEDEIRNFFEEFVILGDPSLRLPQPDGFALEVTPTERNLCCPPETATTYLIEVEQTGSFAETVTLSVAGEPVGATADFSENGVAPPFTSVLTLSNLDGATPGQYEVSIQGSGGSLQRSVQVDLSISAAAPGAVQLTTPPDGAVDVSRTPTLSWQPAAHAMTYEIEIATDPAFADVVYQATETSTTHDVSAMLTSLTDYYWRVLPVNGCGAGDYSATFGFTTLEQADYFTEAFPSGLDLDNFSVSFIPDGSGSFYAMCGESILTLPTDPTGGTEHNVGEDQYVAVTVPGETPVSFYGVDYTVFYAADNGYITFGSGDNDYTETLAEHFSMPRISGLYDDLSVPAGGTISVKQLADRVAVTWIDVPEYSGSETNTFQIELFFNGEIRISWVGVTCDDAIVGLSAGHGLPSDFVETDISEAPACPENPHFRVEATPVSQAICAPSDAVYAVEIQPVLGFDEAVTLSAAGAPASASLSFSANSVQPPFTSLMTVSNTGAGSPGGHTITITGTATGGAEDAADVVLHLATTAPGAVTLTSPSHGAPGVSRTPTLTWGPADQAADYDVEVATDDGFGNIVYSATVSETSHTLETDLVGATTFYWRVRASNACGASGYSAPFSFTTIDELRPQSYDMPNGETGSYTYFDDTYDGDGDNNVSLAPLSGGLGDLTDGVIAVGHWDETPAPYVGWQSVDPTITFHFDGVVNVTEVILHLDDDGGGGGVHAPTDVTVRMGGTTQAFPVTDPPAAEPFAFTCAGLDLVGDELELTIADYSSAGYMMLSDVAFRGGPVGACCNSGQCMILSADACLSSGGAYQGDGADCDPDPCANYEPACVIISEIVAGAESGDCPTWIEITNTGVEDFAFFEGGVIVQTDGSGDVVVDVDLTDVVIPAGASIVINSNQEGACTGAFGAIYGFDADLDTETPFGNGDDRYILTSTPDGSILLDIYGEFGVDGGGEPWEYTAGYAYRLPPYNAGNSGSFSAAEWYFGGVGSLTGGNPTQLLLDNTSPGIHAYSEDCTGPLMPGDLDGDGDCDLEDFAMFRDCLAGPNNPNAPVGCVRAVFIEADLTGDGDVDVQDFGLLQEGFTGSGNSSQ